MDMKQNSLAFYLLLSSVLLTVYLFAASRNDPSLRIAALVSGTGLVSSLASIASTLLTGKDVSKKATDDLPPNSTLTSTQNLQVKTPPAPLAASDVAEVFPQ